MILSYDVKQGDEGKTVQTILKYELNLSASMIRRLKNVQSIYSGDKKVYTTHKPTIGERIWVDITSAEPPCDIVPEDGEIEIIFENEGLIAVNKPSGLITHPSHARYTGTLANFVCGYLEKTYGDGRSHSVNRLDRDTSGVVLFSKNSHFKDRASIALQAEDSSKEYLAIVMGKMPEMCGTIDKPIKRLREQELLRVVAPDGQRAVTHYVTEKTGVINGKEVSLLRLRLETGRTHQIRVHCLSCGCPLLGDIMYYTDESRVLSEELSISKQALHAEKLIFREPISGEILELIAPVSRDDMADIIKML